MGTLAFDFSDGSLLRLRCLLELILTILLLGSVKTQIMRRSSGGSFGKLGTEVVGATHSVPTPYILMTIRDGRVSYGFPHREFCLSRLFWHEMVQLYRCKPAREDIPAR